MLKVVVARKAGLSSVHMARGIAVCYGNGTGMRVQGA